ncbi:MAG: Altered inheritance of mitochondria protein 6 [Chaenotheca gracillima]|nr:MAG: Altered inheritance of mitochondria protein 6 [Chaenotheca gracillima]
MPHKHKRTVQDTSSYELPPTKFAKSLPVAKSAPTNNKQNDSDAKKRRDGKKKSRKGDGFADDTPKAFARLLRFQATGRHPSGLDDGTTPPNKKRKRADAATGAGKSEERVADSDMKDVPTILPGERMSDFAARVDQALPVSGLMGKKTKGTDPAGLKPTRTKLERRMHKMQESWREEEKKRKEKREEMEEDRLDQELENGTSFRDAQGVLKTGKNKKKKKGKGKGKKQTGEEGEVLDDDDDDPWAQIKAARNERPAGLHDVVQAPPEFKKLPKEKFKIMEGAMVATDGVPRSAGSLRRREELGETRTSIVESYRNMMAERRKLIGAN